MYKSSGAVKYYQCSKGGETMKDKQKKNPAQPQSKQEKPGSEPKEPTMENKK